MKRIIFTILTLVICIVFLPTEYVMATEYTDSNGVVYNLDAENQIAIVADCDGSVTTVTIPSTITVEDVSYTVTGLGESAFSYCRSLTSVQLSASITSIGGFAFNGCGSLASVDLPTEVTSIGGSAFQNCSNLKSIVIPTGVTSIGTSTFFNCTNLETVTIPDGVTSIGISAFAMCKNLTNIRISKNVTSIGSNAFGGCNKLDIVVDADNPNYTVDKGVLYNKEKTVLMVAPKASGDFQVMDGVTKIDDYAFRDCTRLTSVTMPDSVTMLDTGVFDGCTGLTSVALSNGLTNIGDYVFQDCSNLQSIIIPQSVTIVSGNAFYGCKILESLVIPDSVTGMSDLQLGGDNTSLSVYCPTRLVEQWKNAENEYMSFDMEIIVAYEVQENGEVSFIVERYPEGITELTLLNEIYGKKVTSVKGLENTDIEVTCVSHGKSAFRYDAAGHWIVCDFCGGTEKVAHTYPGGNTPCECGYVPFTGTASERDIRLELGYSETVELSVSVVPTLGTEAITYKWYENESEIAGETAAGYAVPTGKTMGTYSYTCKVSCGEYSQEYKIATMIVNPDTNQNNPDTNQNNPDTNPNNTDIKQKDDKLIDADGKATYKVTEPGKLNETTGTVTGATVQYVKPVNAKKTTVTIPSTLTVGGVKYKVTSIAKNAFKNNKYIKKLTIGSNVKTIGANAFYNCKKLKTVKLDKNVTTIGDKAFYKCVALTSITIPSKVTKIGKQAFYKCKKLKSITIRSKKLKTSKIGKNAWKGIKSNATIKVPKKKYKAYKKMLKKRGVSNNARFKKI